MTKRLSYTILTLALFLLLPVQSRAENLVEKDKQDMCANLDIIKNLFQVRYAPTFWKRDYAGWDFDGEVENAKATIMDLPEGVGLPIKDYQRMVRDLLLTTKDYHVGVQFFSTEHATLPFQVRSAEGRFFLTFIDREAITTSAFPFKEGDELVLFEGRPVGDVIAELRESEIGNASPLTDQALAEMLLTRRTGERGHIVPRGTITVGIRSKEGRGRSVHLTWKYEKERILPYRPDPTSPQAAIRDFDEESAAVDVPANVTDAEKRVYAAMRERLQKNRLINMEMTAPFYNSVAANFDKQLDNKYALGSRDGYLPRLGPVQWESGSFNHFFSYIYQNEEGKWIGYIRIPHYVAGSWEAEMFREIMTTMEEKTEMLVIDQLNNPGGSVLYLYGLAAALTDRSLSAPRHRLALTQQDIASAYEIIEVLSMIHWEWQAQLMLGPDIGGYPVTMNFVNLFMDYCQFMIDEWNSGHRFTEPHHLLGVDFIEPHPEVQYTKPVLLLVNELDFSGGDFFPAIMQDNARVTVMGVRTAGAGGAVQAFEFPNRFGIAGIRSTVTLAERIDQNPIENLGVTPDIEYVTTVADLQNGFEPMAARVREVVNEMLPIAPRGPVTDDPDNGGDDVVEGGDDSDDENFPFWPANWSKSA